jgi:hypothetical protein
MKSVMFLAVVRQQLAAKSQPLLQRRCRLANGASVSKCIAEVRNYHGVPLPIAQPFKENRGLPKERYRAGGLTGIPIGQRKPVQREPLTSWICQSWQARRAIWKKRL